jgi:hypothetical protein
MSIFRDIRGHADDFVETFPDEGEIDFVKADQDLSGSSLSIHDHA